MSNLKNFFESLLPGIHREITVFVDGLGDSSVNIGSFCYVNAPDFLAAKWEITEEIKLRFDEAGISIPFPQVHVHMEKE